MIYTTLLTQQNAVNALGFGSRFLLKRYIISRLFYTSLPFLCLISSLRHCFICQTTIMSNFPFLLCKNAIHFYFSFLISLSSSRFLSASLSWKTSLKSLFFSLTPFLSLSFLLHSLDTSSSHLSGPSHTFLKSQL